MKEFSRGENIFNPGKYRPLNRYVNKLENLLEGNEGKVDEEAEALLAKAMKEFAEAGLAVTADELLVEAMEKLREKWGGLPGKSGEKLAALRETIIAGKIAGECRQGSDLHDALRKYAVEGKRRGIDLDGKKIEGEVLEILSAQEGE